MNGVPVSQQQQSLVSDMRQSPVHCIDVPQLQSPATTVSHHQLRHSAVDATTSVTGLGRTFQHLAVVNDCSLCRKPVNPLVTLLILCVVVLMTVC